MSDILELWWRAPLTSPSPCTVHIYITNRQTMASQGRGGFHVTSIFSVIGGMHPGTHKT